MRHRNYCYIFLILLISSACNITKYVPEDEYLLNKVKISSDTKTIPKEEIKSYIRQLPNAEVFSIFKMQLAIYSLSGNDTTKWRNRWLRKIGDEPVIYNSEITSFTEKQINRLFFNRGFMNAQVTSAVIHPKNKLANVTYIIKPNEPYRIRNYDVNIAYPELQKIAADTVHSLIKTGNLFDSDVLNAERERIATEFRNLGYFHFAKEYLRFNADSALNHHQVDLAIDVKNDPGMFDSLVTDKSFQKYTFNQINIRYKSDNTSKNLTNAPKIDSLAIDKYNIFYENNHKIHSSALIQNAYLHPDSLYSDRNVERTYSAFNSLSALKYSEISFKEVDQNKLDAEIILTPNKLRSLSTDLEGTYSAGYLGVGGNINYSNRNIFKGSETFSLRGRASYEYQGKGQNAYEFGLDAGLKFPSLLLPFASDNTKHSIGASTEINGTYSYRNRPKEFNGIVTGIGFKYGWNEQLQVKHNFDVLDISYVYYPYIDAEYRKYLATSPYFIYNFQNHLIMRTGYYGSWNRFKPNQPLRSYSVMSYGVETAGNLLYALNNLFNSPKDSVGAYKLFGIRYSQYVKADFNFSHHQIFDKNNRIVYHIGFGLAVPYGNADQIPFEKRYFSGGANSVRGWTAYQLGPGTFQRKGNYIDYNTQMGDIKIDLNMEYRSKLFWKLESAFFIDAGNIWTIKNYDSQPGGAFRFDSFINQLGWAYGVGLRADFSFFVLRLDLGLKLYNPALTRTERWRTSITKNDYAINLAIGYPF